MIAPFILLSVVLSLTWAQFPAVCNTEDSAKGEATHLRCRQTPLQPIALKLKQARSQLEEKLEIHFYLPSGK